MNEHSSALTPVQLDMLMQSLHPNRIKHRTQGGKQLSYVASYDIKATLTRIFGFGGFSADVISSRIIGIREAATTPGHVNADGSAKTPQVLAEATVRLTVYGIGPQGQDVTYTESAVGSNSSYDIGDAADNAIKSGASDALKRCATYLGSQFGASLYDDGKSYELIQVIFEPRQAAMLTEITAAREAAQAEQAAAAQALLHRATGNAPDSAPAPAQEALEGVPGTGEPAVAVQPSPAARARARG